ncbi:hypothetical protein AKO1_002894, partial [Acrasis kona]
MRITTNLSELLHRIVKADLPEDHTNSMHDVILFYIELFTKQSHRFYSAYIKQNREIHLTTELPPTIREKLTNPNNLPKRTRLILNQKLKTYSEEVLLYSDRNMDFPLAIECGIIFLEAE